jgi:hypothetical protein
MQNDERMHCSKLPHNPFSATAAASPSIALLFWTNTYLASCSFSAHSRQYVLGFDTELFQDTYERHYVLRAG